MTAEIVPIKRRRGRPPKLEDACGRCQIGVVVRREVKQKLMRAASANERSIAREVERYIELGLLFERILAIAERREEAV